MFLKEISDDWLFCLYLEGNQDAIDLLFDRYSRFIYGIITQFQKKDGEYYDFEELFQDAMVTFLGCINKYDEESGCFYFFVKKSIERKLIDKIKYIKKSKRIVSLDRYMYDDDGETNLDYICEEDSSRLIENDLYNTLVGKVDAENKEIIDLKMSGYSYQEIAGILGLSKQGVYRRVNKIKNILKDIIEKID